MARNRINDDGALKNVLAFCADSEALTAVLRASGWGALCGRLAPFAGRMQLWHD